MSGKFPTTKIGNIELPRLIIGCNWVSGWSHRTPAKDNMILDTHSNPKSVSQIFNTFLEKDINAVLGLFGIDNDLIDAVHMSEETTGKKMTVLDTVVINVDDNSAARKEAEQVK